ncbi:MAG: hypothetical protein ACT4TC_11290 [Myxococcaceae bacterium]
MFVLGKRYAVFTIREMDKGSIWTRAGSAFINKDGSMNLLLDVLPMNGRLHVREAGERRDAVPIPAAETLPPPVEREAPPMELAEASH